MQKYVNVAFFVIMLLIPLVVIGSAYDNKEKNLTSPKSLYIMLTEKGLSPQGLSFHNGLPVVFCKDKAGGYVGIQCNDLDGDGDYEAQFIWRIYTAD